ncbi:hypothetical protein RJ639_038866 [Escallonia herrerae]|uniref:Large ribosomal subunit protein bL12c n=1 Tax=Escallonia herrerae TaxID=1293975 RepID=A0AA88WM59_9ASTE|nr:hypothetical protein RJ639_038866 [Escallonia herrerae]
MKLESYDAPSKIKIIKEVRSFTDLGLKEAKELVEKTPAVIKKGVSKEEGEQIIEKMKAIGASAGQTLRLRKSRWNGSRLDDGYQPLSLFVIVASCGGA